MNSGKGLRGRVFLIFRQIGLLSWRNTRKASSRNPAPFVQSRARTFLPGSGNGLLKCFPIYCSAFLGWTAKHFEGNSRNFSLNKCDLQNSAEIVIFPDVGARVGERPLCDDVLARVRVAVHEDGVDVVGAVVALERRDVRPEVVG